MNRHRMAMLAISGMVLSCMAAAPILAQTPMGTAFTYQGKLVDGGAPANGAYDLRFVLYDADVGGSQVGPIVTRDDATVADGSFTVSLDFGAVFAGNKRFLEIALRPGASSGSYTTLSPRQELTPTPNAVFSQSAATAPWSGLMGVPAGFADGVDNVGVTSVTAGTGLTGGTITTSGTIGVDFGTTGTSVASGDHNHFGQSWSGNGDGLAVTSNSAGGHGVDGVATATSGTNYGVVGSTASSVGYGVYGLASATTGVNTGVFGQSNGSDEGVGVFGYAKATSGYGYGVLGVANSSDGGIGVSGSGNATSGYPIGVSGFANSTTGGHGVFGWAFATSGPGHGVFGQTRSTTGYGVQGWASASSGVNYGIYGVTGSPDGYAGYFQGRVHVTGTLSKGGGAFKIDHPLDPENRYLYHSFVESPDMMNIYNGNVTTDATGYATIEMPEWFEALNRDFRYQLTVVGDGAWARARIYRKIAQSRFVIQTDLPNVEVSWQVTGIRKDAWAEAHRIQVEEDKTGDEKGTYLHPDVFGQPKEMGLDFKHHPPEVERPDIRPAAKLPRK